VLASSPLRGEGWDEWSLSPHVFVGRHSSESWSPATLPLVCCGQVARLRGGRFVRLPTFVPIHLRGIHCRHSSESWSPATLPLVCCGQVARLRGGRFVRLPTAESLSLVCPRESNQREGQPRVPALRASPAKCAKGLRGFSTGRPALTKNWPASMPATLRAIPPSLRRVLGAPRSKARSRAARVARTWCRRFAPEERACRTMGHDVACRVELRAFAPSSWLLVFRSWLLAFRSSEKCVLCALLYPGPVGGE
jgi:hypothetical protein